MAYFEVGDGEVLLVDFEPPQTVFWNLTSATIWHESQRYRTDPVSLTSAEATTREDGGQAELDQDLRSRTRLLDPSHDRREDAPASEGHSGARARARRADVGACYFELGRRGCNFGGRIAVRSSMPERPRCRCQIVFALIACSAAVVSPAGALNLVQNPSFEDHGKCPTNPSTTPRHIKRCTHWRSPNDATPDCLDRCAGSVPEGGHGPQEPRTGDAYARLLYPTSSEPWWAEYIQSELSAALVAGTTYQVEWWVSLADKSSVATDNMSLNFSQDRVTSSRTDNLNLPQHVRNPRGRVLDDSVGWTLVEGTYTAVGGERWITIGTSGKVEYANADASWSALYYIDDVSVCSPPAQPAFSVDEEFCAGSTITLVDAGTSDEDAYTIQVFRSDAIGEGGNLTWIGCQQFFPGPLPASVDLTALCPAGSLDVPGFYQVELIVQNGCTTHKTAVDWFTVRPASCCSFSADLLPPGPIEGCGSVDLVATPSGGTAPFGYAWRAISSEPLAIVGAPPSLHVSGPIDASFAVEVTDANSCVAQTDWVDVLLEDGLARMELPRLACSDEDVMLDASGSVASSYDLEIYETDYVGSTFQVPATYWQSSTFSGAPGEINLSALYTGSFDAGKVYRVSLAVDNCAVGGEAVGYVVVACCGGCAAPPFDMVGWWSGEGNFLDRTHHANDGAAIGAVSFSAGKVDQAFSLASSASIAVPDSPSLDFASASSGEGDFSIDLWFKSSAFLGFNADAPLVRKQAGVGYEFGYLNDIGETSPVLYLELSDSAGTTRYEAPVAPTLGGWHHAAVTVDRNDGAGIAFLFDGVIAGNGDPTLRAGDLSSGAVLELAPNVPLSGVVVDEIEIFERSLGEDEIELIFDAGADGKCAERCSLTPVLTYCTGETSKTAELELCNDGGVDYDYEVRFVGLAGGDPGAGQGCNADGPAVFTPNPQVAHVDAGACTQLSVSIVSPPDFAVSVPGQTACYVAQVTNLDTASCTSCRALVREPGNFALCPATFSSSLPIGTGLVNVFEFLVSNPGPSMTLDYAIGTQVAEGDPVRTQLRLGGLSAGDPLVGSVSLPAGQTTAIPVSIEVEKRQDFVVEEILLVADLTGDGIDEVLSGATLEVGSGAPVPAFGVLVWLACALGIILSARPGLRRPGSLRRSDRSSEES